VAEDRGVEDRQKAQREVTQNLAQVIGSLDRVLDNLSKSLPASEQSASSGENRNTRRSRVRRRVTARYPPST
jgi:hypothetical protein